MNRFFSDNTNARRLLLITLILATVFVWLTVGGLFMLRSRAGQPAVPTPTVVPTEATVSAVDNAAGGFTIVGLNWPANVTVELSLVPATETPVYVLGMGHSDAAGTFQVDFEWRPGQPAGAGTMVLARSGTVEATAPFTLTPPPDITPVVPTETPTPPASATPQPTETSTAQPTATPTTVPVPPTATIPGGAAGPVCIVTNSVLNLRAGPGTNYHVALVLQRGEELDPIARNADGNWIEVVTFDNIAGWVARDLITCENVDLGRLPVAVVAPPPTSVPPTATAVPPTPTPVTITDWRGEYYNNTALAGSPTVIRNDVAINFAWGRGAPAPTLAGDNFSARWTRWWRFAPGTYRFFLRADDGGRLYVDNSLVLDMWSQGPVRTQTVDLNLSGGDHFLEVHYFEAGGDATIAFWWEQVGTGTGWKGEYFDNRTLSGTPVIVRDDAALNFNWGSGSAAPGLPADHFSARWTRDLTFDAGTYRFSLRADDGVRFWIDGNLLIDEWHPGSDTYTAEVYLTDGRHNLRVEYFEMTGGAIAILDWDRVEQQFPNWKGEYYNNEDLEGEPALVRNDVNINFGWDEGSPGRGVNKDHFSVRWTGHPELSAGTYRFHVTADDGVRLWVNNALVLDEWDGRGGSFISDVVIPTDGAQKVRVEYFEQTGEAEIRLWWEYLPPTPTATAVPPTATPTATTVPPTATATATVVAPTATATATVVPPTATATATVVPPTATPTATTVPPTATPTATTVPPTATPTATAIPPTATATAVPPTATATATAIPPTATATAIPPTATATATAIPPTATATEIPPTATPTATATPDLFGPVAFRTVDQGVQDYDFVRRPVYTAFHSAAEWDAFVQTMHALNGSSGTDLEGLPLRGMKWAREVALAAFLGERPDSSESVAITKVELAPEGLVVTVKRTRAGDVSAQSVTTPYHIVAVSREALPVGALDVTFVTPQGEVIGHDTLQLPVSSPPPKRLGGR